MKKIKELRAQKRKLEAQARAKIAEGNADGADVAAIERAHAEIISQIEALAEQIERAEDELDAAAEAETTETREVEAGTVLSRSAVIELNLVISQFRDMGVEFDLADVLNRNVTPDALRAEGMAKLAEKSRKGPKGGAPDVEIVRDEREGVADAMSIALTTRILAARGMTGINYEGPKDPVGKAHFEKHKDQARQYMGMGLVEMAAACIGYRGRGNYLTANDAIGIFERAFQSTSDFPNIFQNALNKSLLARYTLVTPTYRELAIERPFKDFRPHPQVRAGEFPMIQPVQENGELKVGGSIDGGESTSVTPYGVVFTISRQMLVNDDLGAIDQILGSAGDTVLIFENDTFFTMFKGNPTLKTDSTAVFHANHGNLAGSGAVPSVSTISDARKALRGMKSLSGNFLNVPPAIILAGPDQETVIDQLVATITPTLSGSVNPFSGKLKAVSDANIDDTSWYVAADPGRVPCFIYGFLNGSAGPRTNINEPFGMQGIKVSLEHDFGVGAIDYRGFYKNAGA